MGDTLRKAAQNEALAGLARIATAVLSITFMVVIVPAAFWLVGTTLSTKESLAIQQTINLAQTARIEEHSTLIADLRRARDLDREAVSRLTTDVGRALEKLDGATRALTRIEGYLDTQRRP